jgi:hypothetical protein
MQCACTRAVADHTFRNYDRVLKTDGGVGDEQTYDPRVWSRAAQAAMARRIGGAHSSSAQPHKPFDRNPCRRRREPVAPEATKRRSPASWLGWRRPE